MHLVMRGHFGSCDKDGSHTVRSVIARKPMLPANFMVLCFTEPELSRLKFYITYGFLTFLLLWPWHLPDDLHIQTWPVFPVHVLDVRIWTSSVKAFKSYHLTDRHDWNCIPHHFTGGHWSRNGEKCNIMESVIWNWSQIVMCSSQTTVCQ